MFKYSDSQLDTMDSKLDQLMNTRMKLTKGQEISKLNYGVFYYISQKGNAQATKKLLNQEKKTFWVF